VPDFAVYQGGLKDKKSHRKKFRDSRRSDEISIGPVIAHQEMQQLQKYDTELASSVVADAGTRICFRFGDTDVKRFAGGFSYLKQMI